MRMVVIMRTIVCRRIEMREECEYLSSPNLNKCVCFVCIIYYYLQQIMLPVDCNVSINVVDRARDC